MNDKPAPDSQPWELAVQAAARAFPYPPTPDLAGRVRGRLAAPSRRASGRLRPLAWALAALLLILAGLLAVPQVRAALVEVLQIGGIRIFVVPPTPSAIPPPETPAAPSATPSPSPILQVETPAVGTPAAPPATPAAVLPAATPLASVLDLAGETTLEEARRQAGFTIRTPAYPPDLGSPERVFLQDLGGPLVVLVWTVPGQPGSVRLSLHEFGAGTYADKLAPAVVQETTVNGVRAAWTEGPHLLVFRSGDAGPRELVHGHTLIWEQGGITYRLETDQDLAEAVRIAESVR
jgi:hypothetical protein